MQKALAAVINGLIDYAGLFPPAALALDPAVRNYHRYRMDQDAWMLGRFILPCAKFPEIGPYLDELFSSQPLRISALGTASKTVEEGLRRFESDIRALETLRGQYPNAARIEVFETRVPIDPENTSALIRAVAGLCEKSIAPFIEVGFDRDYRATLPKIIKQIASSGGAGFKLRCGGTEAGAFPSVEQVAFAIVTARSFDVPIKFTAGLHHPIRHFNEAVKTKMHGFLNVFLAAMLAYLRKLDERDVAEVLSIETSDAFDFTADGVRVLSHHLMHSEIERVRKDRVTSFGSCSFDEPRDDLRALGWM
jgi:hypothetical protein